jgi:hypothetical protein
MRRDLIAVDGRAFRVGQPGGGEDLLPESLRPGRVILDYDDHA